MFDRMKSPTNCLMTAVFAVLCFCATEAEAQKLQEDFENVAEDGGVFFYGQGFGDTEDFGWDSGLVGEQAFGNTEGNVHADFSAVGDATVGVNNSGGAVLSVGNVNLNLLDDDLHALVGGGPVTVLQGDGVTANTSGFIVDWDGGIDGGAFGGTSDGAILVGDVTAEACLGCGLSNAGAEIKVTNVDTNGPGNWFGGLWWDVPGFPPGSGPLLFNAGLDRNGGTLEPWIGEGNASSAPTTPRSGSHVLKMFGGFTGALNITKAYQDVAPAVAGQTWELKCWVRHNDLTGDPLGDYLRDGNRSEMKILFYDASDVMIASTGVQILDETDQKDVWIERGPIELIAPAGTAKAQALFTFIQPAVGSGATLIDDITFRDKNADYTAFLSQFEVSAFVKGAANGANGEFLGDVQIRVEDTDGDRLVLSDPASTSFQYIGGMLDTFAEQNSDQVNSNGAFNPASDSFRVVVAFDNDVALTWGSGGTLTVDDLLMSNTFSSSADDYVAAMIWEGLPSLGAENLDKLFLRADIKGSVLGGTYQLVVEGFNTIPELNEDFETITSNGEDVLVAPLGGGGDFTNWNDEIAYESAIFGLGGTGGVVTSTGGVFARGCTDCGSNGTPGAQIEVLDVALNPGGEWYAGFKWENRTLGSDVLGDITLEADMAGDWAAGLFQCPVDYMLRIEDPDGDYLGFKGVFVTTNTFETVGGLLSNYNTNGTVSGNDGVFDLDTNGAEYKVVIVFIGRDQTFCSPIGNFGGTLTVDNVTLTPGGVPSQVQSGYVGYEGTIDTNGAVSKSIGGLLSSGSLSTFIGEGGEFWNASVQNWGIPSWDSGLIGEDAFAGFWGNGFHGTVAAQGCTDCGTNGTGGGTYFWNGSGISGFGGWWAGVAWRPVFTFTNPNQVRLVGDFRAEWDSGAGEFPGTVYYALESSPNNKMEFPIDAQATTNGWFHVDDTLNNANPVGSLVWGAEQQYSLVISCYGIDPTGDWGAGGTVYFDDLKLIVNGITIFEEDFETAVGPTSTILRNSEDNPLDTYTVKVSMEQGIDTWGASGGTLTVDNLQLGLAGSCDDDDDLDLGDFAVFQQCMGGDGSGACECADTDGDGDVDGADYEVWSQFVDGPG